MNPFAQTLNRVMYSFPSSQSHVSTIHQEPLFWFLMDQWDVIGTGHLIRGWAYYFWTCFMIFVSINCCIVIFCCLENSEYLVRTLNNNIFINKIHFYTGTSSINIQIRLQTCMWSILHRLMFISIPRDSVDSAAICWIACQCCAIEQRFGGMYGLHRLKMDTCWVKGYM